MLGTKALFALKNIYLSQYMTLLTSCQQVCLEKNDCI